MKKVVLGVLGLVLILMIGGCSTTKTARISGWGIFVTEGVLVLGNFDYYRTTVEKDKAVSPQEFIPPPTIKIGRLEPEIKPLKEKK